MTKAADLKKQLQELNSVISETRQNLGRLIAGFSEDLPTNKYAQVSREIAKVRESLASLEGKRVDLNKQIEFSAAEPINKAIDTLEKKLQSLNEQRARGNQDLINGTATIEDLRAIDLQIEKTSKALASFEARRVQGYTPQGAVKTQAYVNEYNRQEQAMYKAAANEPPLYNPFPPGGKGGANPKASTQEPPRLTRAQENAAAFEKEQLALKSMLSTSERYRTVWQEIVALHMEDAKLSVKQYPQGGVAEVTATKTEAGITNTQKFGVDTSGNVTPTVPRAYQTFTQGIIRDFRELTKWSVAIALIYGPLNALQGLMQKMVENEAKLSQISVAVNENIASQSQIFDSAAQAAQATGEELGGVLDAFDQAFRATGRISDGTQRYITTEKLLNDSLILSKISTLSQAEAIDTLTAALYQSNKPLDTGASLLDDWVTVSKTANVDVATLAQGVAILGDAAETAGVSTQQLNAIVATLAEVSLESGKEAANAAKALVGSYQSPEAEKALGRIGIAVKDTTGKTRDFLSVMSDVATLRQKNPETGQQILGDQQFSAITLALGGGGQRRQKDVANFIENFGRIKQLTDVQNGDQGASADALAKRLETVQTALTRLGNAFQQLGQSLGEKGGLLADFTALVNLATTLVTVLDKLAGALGKTGPLLLGLGAASLINGGKGGFAGNLLSQFTTDLNKPTIGTPNESMLFGPGITGGTQRGFASPLGRGALAATAVAIPAIQNIANKDYAAAGADVAGGIAGFLVGGPGGALIGTAIAESFVRSTLSYDTQFANFFAGTIKKGSETSGKESTNDLTNQAFAAAGFGSVALGKFAAKNSQQSLIGENAGKGFATPEAAVLEWLSKQTDQKNKDLYNKIVATQIQTTGNLATNEITPFAKKQQGIYQRDSGYLSDLESGRQADLRQQLYKGQIKTSDFQNQTSNLGGFPITATRYMAAFGDEFTKLQPQIKNTKDEYQAWLDVVTYGSQDQLDSLSSVITEIDTVQTALEHWSDQSEKVFGRTKAQEEQYLADLKQGAASTASSILTSAIQNKFQLPPIVSVGQQANGNGITKQDLASLISKARTDQEKYYQASGMSQSDIAAFEQGLPEFAVKITDAGQTFYDIVNKAGEKVDQSFLQAAAAAQGQGLGIQSLNATQAQYNQAMAAYPATIQKLVSLGYKPNEEESIVKLTDSQFFKQTADWKVMQLLLGRIADLNQKQLDGMYNIPEGATFWVPLTAAYYKPEGGAGGGLDTAALNEALNPNTQKTAENTLALQTLTGVLQAKAVSGITTEVYDRVIEGLKRPPTASALVNKYGQPLVGPGSSSPQGMTPEQLQALSFAQRRNEYSPENLQNKNFAERRTATETPEKTPDIFQQISQFYKSLANLEKPLYSDASKNKIDTNAEAIGNFMNLLSNFFSNFQENPSYPTRGGMNPNINPAQGATSQMNVTPVTKLDLRIDSTTSLMVDGRVLAQIIKPYLAADLLQAQQTQSSTTRQYVI